MTYFVTLDDKESCVGVYSDGELHFGEVPVDLHYTWRPSASLTSISAADAEFAYFYANGKSLSDVCPPHLKEGWEGILKRMEAYKNSFRIAKVNLQDHCLFDLIPKQYLTRYCDLKTEIIKHVFKTHVKPENYDFMRSLSEMLQEMQKQKIHLNLAPVKRKGLRERLFQREEGQFRVI